MLRDTLSQTDLLELPLFAFFLFLTLFVVITVRVMRRKKNDPVMVATAALPLANDTESHHES